MKKKDGSQPRKLYQEVLALVREGVTPEIIMEMILPTYPSENKSDYRARINGAISNARHEIEREERIRWKGPWPISYVRDDGEPVYRVGAGHDVPEGSLRALGFQR